MEWWLHLAICLTHAGGCRPELSQRCEQGGKGRWQFPMSCRKEAELKPSGLNKHADE